MEGSLGFVVDVWRHPVKSLLGERIEAADLTVTGLFGDRAHVFLDVRTGKALSAKNPKRWPNLLQLRAAYVSAPQVDSPLPPVQIALPGGEVVRSDERDASPRLSEFLGGAVRLVSTVAERPSVEIYWPDVEGLGGRDGFGEYRIPTGPFYDSRPLLLLTTATLDRLQQLYAGGRFDARRFRPNLVIGTPPSSPAFPEQSLVGRTLAIGRSVRLRVVKPCSRCVMTTLAQGDLPVDLGILKTVAAHAQGRVGVYAEVVQPGRVRLDDAVRIEAKA